MQTNETHRKKSLPEITASVTSIVTNLILATVKLICGILCAAPALISDAIHSAADLFSTFIVLIGIRLSAKAPDARHPYGHERFECIASILLSGILLAAGIGIGYGGISDILSGAYRSASPPMAVAIWVALLSVAAKLVLSRYMNMISKKTHSTALRADAFHQISDALASLGALCGIVASILGFPIFDPIASVFISLFLFRASVGIFREAAAGLIDRAADEETEKNLRLALESVSGITVKALRTRLFGSKLYVEAEILFCASCALSACMPVADLAKERLLASDPRVKGCTLSLVPCEPP